MFRPLTAALGVMPLFAGAARADDKPNDAQIAHMAYAVGQIDIAAADTALKTSHNKAAGLRMRSQRQSRDDAAMQ